MKCTHAVPRDSNTSLCGIFDAWIPPRNEAPSCKTCRKILYNHKLIVSRYTNRYGWLRAYQRRYK